MIKQNEYRKTYSKDFKLRAVQMKLQGHSYQKVSQDMGIPDKSILKSWLRNYKTYGEVGLEERRGKLSTGRPRKRPLTPEQELAKRIRRLEMENEILKKLLELQGRDVPLR